MVMVVVGGRGGGYFVSSESVKTIKRASNRGSIVQWELLWGNKRSIGFIALEHQPTNFWKVDVAM